MTVSCTLECVFTSTLFFFIHHHDHLNAGMFRIGSPGKRGILQGIMPTQKCWPKFLARAPYFNSRSARKKGERTENPHNIATSVTQYAPVCNHCQCLAHTRKCAINARSRQTSHIYCEHFKACPTRAPSQHSTRAGVAQTASSNWKVILRRPLHRRCTMAVKNDPGASRNRAAKQLASAPSASGRWEIIAKAPPSIKPEQAAVEGQSEQARVPELQ